MLPNNTEVDIDANSDKEEREELLVRHMTEKPTKGID